MKISTFSNFKKEPRKLYAEIRYFFFTVSDNGPFKVNQKMAIFRFGILGLKPRHFPRFEPKYKSASKSGFEFYSAVCNC